MSFGIYQVPPPVNEPVKGYAPGSPERRSLQARLASMAAERIEVPLVSGGKELRTGRLAQAVMSHDHAHVLADVHMGGEAEVALAIEAARKAKAAWSEMPWEQRVAIFLKAADLLAVAVAAARVVGAGAGQGQGLGINNCYVVVFFA